MAAKKRGLGKGLDALLNPRTVKELESVQEGDVLKSIAVDLLQRGRYQPRTEIDQSALQELSESIKTQGIIQPILVRPLTSEQGQYEIIAGERRWRAAQMAGLHEVPVVVRDIDDHTAMCMALIENIQREDLNPIDEAEALYRLVEEFDMTHDSVAESVGRSRSAVTNLLRLLELDPKVKQMVKDRKLEMGHARSLLSLSAKQQYEFANAVIKRGLSVRATEALVRSSTTKKQGKTSSSSKLDPNIRSLQQELSDKIGASVVIKHAKTGKGSLVIQYHNLDELDGIIKRIK